MKLATVYTLRAGLAYHAFVAKQSPMKNLEELAVFFFMPVCHNTSTSKCSSRDLRVLPVPIEIKRCEIRHKLIR